MKIGDLIIWGDRQDVWIVVNINKSKKTWHRYVEIYHPNIGVMKASWNALKEAEVKILKKDATF